jgi:hypothetical protein
MDEGGAQYCDYRGQYIAAPLRRLAALRESWHALYQPVLGLPVAAGVE